MQDRYAICDESGKLNEHEKNQPTHDLELASILHALNMWIHYPLGSRFVLMSDHSGLRYLFDKPNQNGRKAQWLAMIIEFDFKIRYIKGKENMMAYALSRCVQVNQLAAMSYYGIDLQDRVLQVGEHDVNYMEIMYTYLESIVIGTSTSTCDGTGIGKGGGIGVGTQDQDYFPIADGLV